MAAADVVHEEDAPAATTPRFRWQSALLPVALLGVMVAVFALANPAQWLDSGAPPAEELVFERVELRPGEIVLHVRNGVSAEFVIAQVIVDDAYWAFTASPGNTLGRYEAATITVPYPWVEGETHVVGVLSGTGLVWDHEIAVAIETPQPTAAAWGRYALIGALVGVLPVVAGMALYPVLRGLGPAWMSAILALTLGLLGFLAVDTIAEGVELAELVPGAFQGMALFVGAALLAVAGVLALDGLVSAKRGAPESLALMIAIGIGLHNMGEGLLIGSAFAVGSLALGGALILGFAIHNVTEGPAIVAPHVRGGRLPSARFALLALVAGAPTIPGAWLGAFAGGGALLPTVFFGLGAGAIVVVVVQVLLAMRRSSAGVLTPLNLGAFALGYGAMVATGLLTA